MLEEIELAGTLVELDEVCRECKGRVVIVTPSGDGDLSPRRIHEWRGQITPCPIAQDRRDDVLDTDAIDELLGADRPEGPE
jgi:hypothetical protein